MFDEEDDDFFEGNLNEDIDRFERYLNGGDPFFLDSDKLEMIIDHFLMNAQYNKANLAAEYAITQFGYNIIFYVRKAQAMSALGLLKEALNLLGMVEKWESPSCEFLLTKASLFSQLRDSKQAIRFFNEALRVAEKEDRDEIYMDLAMEYENRNDYKNALRVLREALAANPKNEAAIYEIAFCYNQLGDFDNAIKAYTDFIDENPYSFTSWYNLGNAYSQNNDFEKAIWAYDYCILINEDFGPVYFNMGNAYLSEEKFHEAIASFRKCMELDGEDPVALCYLGEAYEQLGELDEAATNYHESLKLAPMFPDAWLGLGIVEDLRGNMTEAIRLIEYAVDLDPENAGFYHVLAGAYEKAGQTTRAEENYIKSLSLDSKDEDCLIAYMDFLSDISLLLARDYIQNFLSLTDENPVATLLEVNILYKLGEKQEALHKFTQIASKNVEKAREIFDLNADLLNVPEFVHLTEE